MTVEICRYVFTPMLSGLRWPGQTDIGSWPPAEITKSETSRSFTSIQMFHTHTHGVMYMYVPVYIYIYMCVCLCVHLYTHGICRIRYVHNRYSSRLNTECRATQGGKAGKPDEHLSSVKGTVTTDCQRMGFQWRCNQQKHMKHGEWFSFIFLYLV